MSLTAQPETTVTSWGVYLRPAGTPAGDPQQQVLATGTGTTVTAEIDPTLLANGSWVLTITTAGSDGGRSVTDTSLVVDGALKLGRYTTTYLDLDVPVAGIPIQVLRTYDTLKRNEPGDFGYGWNLELANFRVQTNRTLGQGPWTINRQCIPNPQFGKMYWLPCFETSGPRYVTVTWPDGRTETFDLQAATTDLFPNIGTATYKPRAGVTSKLAPAPGQGTFSQFNGTFYTDFFNPREIWNPTRFVLTAADGTRYLLDKTSGLVEATDRQGNTITVTPNGVRSSTGEAIDIERDPNGQIDAVVATGGATVTYERDANGDLALVTDARQFETTFNYHSDHYLDSVDDPGPGLVRKLDYDPDTGRLSQITDASGSVVTVDVDPDARTEVVSGNEGRLTTISTYDETGNLLTLDQVHDGITRRTNFGYTPDGQLRSRTNQNDPSLTWSADYDTAGNLATVTEADGDQISMTYYPDHNLKTWTDGEQRTTTYDYTNGVLTRVSPPDRDPIEYVPNDRGLIEQVIDPVDGNRSYTYDTAGRIRTETTAAGTTTWTYNSAGLPATQVGARGDSSWTYDDAGNVLTETTVEGTTTWTYDHNGNVRTVVGPDQSDDATFPPAEVTVTFTYDELGMPESRTVNGTTTSWTYDGSLLRTETTAEGTTTWGYDGARRQTTQTGPDGDWKWDWDDRDRVHTVTRPDASVVEMTWYDDGRIRQIDDPVAGTSTYEYDGAGNLTRVIHPTETRTYQWDTLGSLIDTTRTERSSDPVTPQLLMAAAVTAPAPPAPPRTPAAPASFDGLVHHPRELTRAPRGPTAPQRSGRSGGGGVLLEYAMLVDMALTAAPAIADLGVATYERLTQTVDVLTQASVPNHRAPDGNPVDAPGGQTEDLPRPEDDEEGGGKRPPTRTRDCEAGPENEYDYGDEAPLSLPLYTGTDKPAAQYAIGVLYRRKDEPHPGGSIQPPGYRLPALTNNMHKTHLIAKGGLGGKGVYGNLVAGFIPMNNAMKGPEEAIRAALDLCQSVLVDVRPIYADVAATPDELWSRTPRALPVDAVVYEFTVEGVGVVSPPQVFENRE